MAGGTRRVVWTERAREGLDEALGFVAEQSPGGASKILEAALLAASSLTELADRGRLVPELEEQDLREIFVFRYRMLYEVTPAAVYVLAFLHGARDFDSWWRSSR